MDKSNRPILVIDLSKERAQGLFWNDKIQSLVIKRLLDGLSLTAEAFYKEGQSLNALVVIDEAHRLAPRALSREEDTAQSVRSVLIDAARTTRKYGLGWLFISQTLSSLHAEILQQLRICFFRFGLGLGQEFQSLRQLVGSSSKALDLYQLFRDPHSAFDIESRQYSFMTIGPVSPLSFSGTPLFFERESNVSAVTANLGTTPRSQSHHISIHLIVRWVFFYFSVHLSPIHSSCLSPFIRTIRVICYFTNAEVRILYCTGPSIERSGKKQWAMPVFVMRNPGSSASAIFAPSMR